MTKPIMRNYELKIANNDPISLHNYGTLESKLKKVSRGSGIQSSKFILGSIWHGRFKCFDVQIEYYGFAAIVSTEKSISDSKYKENIKRWEKEINYALIDYEAKNQISTLTLSYNIDRINYLTLKGKKILLDRLNEDRDMIKQYSRCIENMQIYPHFMNSRQEIEICKSRVEYFKNRVRLVENEIVNNNGLTKCLPRCYSLSKICIVVNHITSCVGRQK